MQILALSFINVDVLKYLNGLEVLLCKRTNENLYQLLVLCCINLNVQKDLKTQALTELHSQKRS